MPKSPAGGRKSSMGNGPRRGQQKAHVPYHADDTGLGRKTGYVVGYVDRRSDEFEPFDKVILQADTHSPVKVQGRRKKKKTAIERISEEDEEEDEETDEDGEKTMELVDSDAGSPMRYFTNAQRAVTPNSPSRSQRRVPRQSDVDYDKVPSPRRGANSSQRSRVRPSMLSQSTVPEPDDYDMGDMDIGGGFGDIPPDDPDVPSPTHSSPRGKGRGRPSFSSLAQDDPLEDEEDAAPAPSSPSPKRGQKKGTSKYPLPELDDGVEQAIDEGLRALDDEPDPDDEEEPAQSPPKKKKARVVAVEAKKKERKQREPSAESRGRTEEREGGEVVIRLRSVSPTSVTGGVRRSTRHRYAPLDWWRNEHVVYGRRDTNHRTLLAPIREIVTFKRAPPDPLGKRTKKRKRAGSVKKEVLAENPEEGWDDATEPHGQVNDFVTGLEVKRRIAFTEKMLDPRPAAGNAWYYQKIFGDGNFIAAGQLIIPPKGRKPNKPSKDNSYVFYVISGAVNLRIHNSSMILATGGMFLVPRGNVYDIENVSDREARLLFTQARKMWTDEEEAEGAGAVAVASSGRRSSEGGGRSSSGGGAPEREKAKRAPSLKV